MTRVRAARGERVVERDDSELECRGDAANGRFLREGFFDQSVFFFLTAKRIELPRVVSNAGRFCHTCYVR